MATYSQTKVIKQKEVKYKGKTLLISWIQWLHSGLFEVAVLKNDGDFLESMENVDSYEDAKWYFDKYVKKYSEKKIQKVEDTKIPERYLKFARDYNHIYQNCKQYFQKNPIIDDGSASNFDCCTVFIGKRVKKGFLEAALRPYGLRANLHRDNIISVVVPYTQYQGNGNTLQAKYMTKGFIDLGYEADMFYQID